MAFILKALSISSLLITVSCQHGAYSYNKFSGPVSGQIREIQVQAAPHLQQYADYGYDHHRGQIHPETAKYAQLRTVDYVAKPDYHYAYGVEDPRTGNLQNHQESRNGDVVHGEYSLMEPDGSVRVVRYTADPKNGFQATVHKKSANGQSAPVHYGRSDDDIDDERD